MMWHYYTHLDPVGLRPEDLPIELFLSYEKWIGALARRLHHKERKAIMAEVDHIETNGRLEKRVGEIVEFDPATLRFKIVNHETKYKTWRPRMELRLLEDPRDHQKI